MKCNDARRRLPDFVGNALTTEEEAMVKKHLDGCAACRREEVAMRELIGLLGKDAPWTPPAPYWDTLLPRIHSRIDAKAERRMPAWIVRVAVPLAAAALVAVIAIPSLPTGGTVPPRNLQEALQGVPGEELQSFAEQQSVDAIADPVQYPIDNSAFADDKVILKEILSDEIQVVQVESLDQESTLYAMSDQEAEEVVAKLERSLLSAPN